MSKALEEQLGFRVRGANVEWVDPDRSGARPATNTEKAMWEMLVAQHSLVADLQVKYGRLQKQLAKSLDAHSVRNSLGDPLDAEGGGEPLTERELRAKKLAGG